MRFEFDPVNDDPEVVQAEAQQQIAEAQNKAAFQLERIADALEADGDVLLADGGRAAQDADGEERKGVHPRDGYNEGRSTGYDCPKCGNEDAVQITTSRLLCADCGEEWTYDAWDAEGADP